MIAPREEHGGEKEQQLEGDGTDRVGYGGHEVLREARLGQEQNDEGGYRRDEKGRQGPRLAASQVRVGDGEGEDGGDEVEPSAVVEPLVVVDEGSEEGGRGADSGHCRYE